MSSEYPNHPTIEGVWLEEVGCRDYTMWYSMVSPLQSISCSSSRYGKSKRNEISGGMRASTLPAREKQGRVWCCIITVLRCSVSYTKVHTNITRPGHREDLLFGIEQWVFENKMQRLDLNGVGLATSASLGRRKSPVRTSSNIISKASFRAL